MGCGWYIHQIAHEIPKGACTNLLGQQDLDRAGPFLQGRPAGLDQLCDKLSKQRVSYHRVEIVITLWVL